MGRRAKAPAGQTKYITYLEPPFGEAADHEKDQRRANIDYDGWADVDGYGFEMQPEVEELG